MSVPLDCHWRTEPDVADSSDNLRWLDETEDLLFEDTDDLSSSEGKALSADALGAYPGDFDELGYGRALEQLTSIQQDEEEPVDNSACEQALLFLLAAQGKSLPAPEVKRDPPEGVLLLWTQGTRSTNGLYTDVLMREDQTVVSYRRFLNGALSECDRVEFPCGSIQEVVEFLQRML